MFLSIFTHNVPLTRSRVFAAIGLNGLLGSSNAQSQSSSGSLNSAYQEGENAIHRAPTTMSTGAT